MRKTTKTITAAIGILAAVFMNSCSSSPKTAQIEEMPQQEEIPANVSKYESDGFQTYWISETAEPSKNQASMFPGVTDAIIKELGIEDGIPSSMSTFLMKVDGKNLVFDAGLGAPTSLMLPSLKALGVEPGDVDAIFMTHLHGDHVGGLSKDGNAVFPNAKVYLSRTEYETMGGEEIFAPYKDRVVLFDFDENLPYGIKALNAVGHTPGHTAYLKGDVLIAGDLMHGVALQIAHPEFCATYDKDTEASVASRIRLINMAKEKKMLLCGMHFPGGVVDFRSK